MDSNTTIIYLRSKSTQPIPGQFGEAALPRKGSPIGAIAYVVSEGILEVSYSLQHAKHDSWNRERCSRIVLDRLEKKRETCTKQYESPDGSTEEYETTPKYFRIEIPEPVLSTDEPTPTRPYDVLNLILAAEAEGQIKVPARLTKTISRMIIENDCRIALLTRAADENTVFVAVRKLHAAGVSFENIVSHLERLTIKTQPVVESLAALVEEKKAGIIDAAVAAASV